MTHDATGPAPVGRAEAFNCASHLVGAVLAAAGLVPLVVFAARSGDPWRITGVAVFGATLVSLYVVSSAYHGLRGRLRALFQKLDHTAIYLLIAGTWTPFALVDMRNAWGLTLLGVVWGLAVVGIGFAFRREGPSRRLPAGLGLVMGWLGVFALGPLSRALPMAGLVGIFVGGLLYTVGVVFYALDRRLAFGHGVFHVLVLGGSIAHYLVVLLYLA
jgi:hemolysin III